MSGHAGLDGPVSAAVLVASSTRTPGDDASGALVADGLVAAGLDVASRTVVDDDVDALQNAVRQAVGSGAKLVVITGGTGLSTRDVTPEAIEPLFERRIDGFGELFRQLSFAEIGAGAMSSRATAGVVGGALVFAIPGSPGGARLAVGSLIAPQARHLLGQMHKVEARRTAAGAVPPLPACLANLPAAAALLDAAPLRGTTEVDGRNWRRHAWPTERGERVLLTGAERDGWPELRASHRRAARTFVAGDALPDAVVVTGRAAPKHGAILALDGARLWYGDGDSTWSWNGRRVVPHGTRAQLLASLVTDWHAR